MLDGCNYQEIFVANFDHIYNIIDVISWNCSNPLPWNGWNHLPVSNVSSLCDSNHLWWSEYSSISWLWRLICEIVYFIPNCTVVVSVKMHCIDVSVYITQIGILSCLLNLMWATECFIFWIFSLSNTNIPDNLTNGL